MSLHLFQKATPASFQGRIGFWISGFQTRGRFRAAVQGPGCFEKGNHLSVGTLFREVHCGPAVLIPDASVSASAEQQLDHLSVPVPARPHQCRHTEIRIPGIHVSALIEKAFHILHSVCLSRFQELSVSVTGLL
jgi:hypothetical protein